MKRFDGRTVLITGAASGIGRASAERIAREGGFICAIDRNAEGLAEVVAAIRAAEGEAEAFVCDLGDAAQITATVAAAVEHRGAVHALCNVAGILRADHSHEIKLEAWETVLRVNLTGTFLMCQAAIPHLLKTKGAIVNTSSSAALGGHPWMTAYAASKGGILSMTRSLACEYGPQGLRVNTVVPGAIITPIHGGFRMPKGADPELIRRIIPTVPYGQPEQVAGAIAFFASDDANYCNGAELRVDGGMMS